MTNEKISKILTKYIKSENFLDECMTIMERENIQYITLKDPSYPLFLKQTADPPEILFYRGVLPKDDLCIAVVGTRKASQYGLEATRLITQEICRMNFCVVSGLAYGIDSMAHSTTLLCQGKTIAVLGSGIDSLSIYPTANKNLAEKIISSGGCVLSEFPPKTPPLKHHFPQRNRIISGLSKGVVVIEAAHKSGAMITARYAGEQGRDIFALPGDIFRENAFGPNTLIQAGAWPLLEAQDISKYYGFDYKKSESKKYTHLSNNEKAILAVLKNGPMESDTILEKTQLNISDFLICVTTLEMQKLLKKNGDTFQLMNSSQ